MNALWCGWRMTEKGKVPFQLANGEHARSNDESTFATYPVLLNNLHKFLRFEGGRQIGGVGLGIFRGYSAIDIDHCVDQDGNLSDMAREIVDYCGSYTEYSPSKTGIRIIFKTTFRIDKSEYYTNNRSKGLEVYISDNTNKFVSITGNKISGDSIAEVDLAYIMNKYMKKGGFDVEKAAKKDPKLAELWNAKAPGAGSNESELDMALACKLAYYAKNDEIETKRLFEESPYFKSKDPAHMKKWNGGYGADTIKNAVSFVGVPQNVPIKRYDLNDTGNAHRFVDMFGRDVRYNVDNKVWMSWNGNHWQYDVAEYVKNLIEILAEKMSYDSASVSDMNERMRIAKNIDHIYGGVGKDALLKEARHMPGVPVFNADFDKDKYLLCCNDGTIDLRTKSLRPSEREDMISMTTACGVDMDHEPKAFVKFINDIFADSEVAHYVHKALGYSISNSTREQCIFILHGDGNNGKSLLLDVIANVLGSYAVVSRPQLLTESDFGTSNTEEIARLNGKRFCSVNETKSGDKLDEQLIKELSSGIGKVTARFLYSGSFEFYVTCKIWLASNYEPVIKGTDKGIWRRIVKIPVPTDFTGKEDKDLRDKLLAEKERILGWLIKGYEMYEKEGLEKPEAIVKATADYRKEMDIVQQWIDEYCEIKPSNFERANVLYDSFRNFCMRRDQRTNQTIFGRNLGKKFKKYNSGEGIVYIGLRLKRGAADLSRKVAYEQTEVDENV